MYKVMADINFHCQKEDERYTAGTFSTEEEALAKCKSLVDVDLESWAERPGITEKELYDLYVMFGEDPYIVPIDGASCSVKFSAWDYASERCHIPASRGTSSGGAQKE